MSLAAVESLLDTPIAKAEPKRDRWGRPLIRLEGETKPKALTRVTTLAGTLSDRFALEQWSNRMVILGIAQRRDLYASASALTPDDKSELNQLAAQAKEAAGSSAGATTGTALHKLTERLDAGETVVAPEPWGRDLEAYQATMTAHGIEVIPGWLEQFMVCRELGVAGTADRIVRHDGKLRIADLKTGSFLNWGEISIQLACYANAETHYDAATETHTPAPDIDKTTGLVMHLPAGKAQCVIYEVDLVAGWEWAKIAAEVRAWRNTKPATPLTLTAVSQPEVEAAPPASAAVSQPSGSTAPDIQRLNWLKTRLTYLKANHPDALATIASFWPLNVPTFTADHKHTPGELEGIRNAVSAGEAEHRLPFPEEPCPRSSSELVARCQALPPDLLDNLQAEASAEQITNLKLDITTGAQLDRLAQLLEEPEQQHNERLASIEQLLMSVADDDASLRSSLTHLASNSPASGPVTLNPKRLTAGGLRMLGYLVEAIETNHLVFVASTSTEVETDWELQVADPDRTLALLLTTSSKSELRDQAKATAEMLQLPIKPRAAADALTHPLMLATILWEHNQQHKNRKQTA